MLIYANQKSIRQLECTNLVKLKKLKQVDIINNWIVELEYSEIVEINAVIEWMNDVSMKYSFCGNY